MSVKRAGVPDWVKDSEGSPVVACPNCGSKRSSVTDSRKRKSGFRRRRVCRSCEHRYGTIEITWEEFQQLRSMACDREEKILARVLAALSLTRTTA